MHATNGFMSSVYKFKLAQKFKISSKSVETHDWIENSYSIIRRYAM